MSNVSDITATVKGLFAIPTAQELAAAVASWKDAIQSYKLEDFQTTCIGYVAKALVEKDASELTALVEFARVHPQGNSRDLIKAFDRSVGDVFGITKAGTFTRSKPKAKALKRALAMVTKEGVEAPQWQHDLSDVFNETDALMKRAAREGRVDPWAGVDAGVLGNPVYNLLKNHSQTEVIALCKAAIKVATARINREAAEDKAA